MFTPQQFLDSCRHETRVIQHLATKVKPERLDWRPTPGQRSTLELLRYLTSCAISPALAMVSGSWDEAERLEKESEDITAATFSAGMDRQMAALTQLVSSLPAQAFLEQGAKMPWGTPCKLGEALVNTVIKTLTAYRMQLFLYAKESGASELGPADCWVGVSPKPATV